MGHNLYGQGLFAPSLFKPNLLAGAIGVGPVEEPHHSGAVRLMLMGLYDEQERISEGKIEGVVDAKPKQPDEVVVEKEDGSAEVKSRVQRKRTQPKRTRRRSDTRAPEPYRPSWPRYFREPTQPDIDISGIALRNQTMVMELVNTTLYPTKKNVVQLRHKQEEEELLLLMAA